MSKHNDLKKLAKTNIKILSSNKIKLRKGQKISIKPMVEESLSKAVVSRLEGIIDGNTEKFESSHVIKSEATALCQIKMADIISHTSTDGNVVPTIVHVVTKKNALDFDFAGEGIIGDLLRSSTLGPVYQKLKNGWKELNTDDKSDFTNILFMPNIFVFINGIEALFNPFKVNLLLVAVPTFTHHKESLPEDATNVETGYIGRVYGDIMDAATKIEGCTDLIIDPFDLKITKNFQHEVINMWNYLIDSIRCRKVVRSIWFSIEDEFNYVLFIAEKGVNKLMTIASTEEEIPFEDASSFDDDEDEDLDDITDEIVSDMEEKNDKKKRKVKASLEDFED